eukprot:TRINITY_DN49424_c0_g1_i1.p1 TRINITY_DN49424_c0_g1~~TRINITY_DN49424_c0_g1_i1.p1  ORF type:complete len:296 (+),score=23.08 TRINITY_DN49424_c0_g1_i1:36-890(+)
MATSRDKFNNAMRVALLRVAVLVVSFGSRPCLGVSRSDEGVGQCSAASCGESGEGVWSITEVPRLLVGSIAEPVVDAALAEVEARLESSHRWEELESDGSRRPLRSTLNFGWDFVRLEQGVQSWIDIPPAIDSLREAVLSVFGNTSTDLKGLRPRDLDNIIVTIYGPGDAVVPHYDRDDTNVSKPYYFEDSIFGVVLRPDDGAHLFFQKEPGESKGSLRMDQVRPDIELQERKGTVFMMLGEIRHWPYYHGVLPTSTNRISVTLRATQIRDPAQILKPSNTNMT